jgi:hypothetical protein
MTPFFPQQLSRTRLKDKSTSFRVPVQCRRRCNVLATGPRWGEDCTMSDQGSAREQPETGISILIALKIDVDESDW